MAPVRLVLADDHLVLRQALKALLERRGMEVVAEAADGRGAIEAVTKHSPDVVVLDVIMPGLNGVDAAREIARTSPACPIILLSGVDDTRFVTEALKVGVRGFVQKSQGCDDLVQAIEDACAAAEGGDGGGGPSLTPRERQVLQLVGEGRSTKQIAEVLHISVKTAEFHRGRLMKKLNVHDTANLVRYAIREGWIAP